MLPGFYQYWINGNSTYFKYVTSYIFHVFPYLSSIWRFSLFIQCLALINGVIFYSFLKTARLQKTSAVFEFYRVKYKSEILELHLSLLFLCSFIFAFHHKYHAFTSTLIIFSIKHLLFRLYQLRVLYKPWNSNQKVGFVSVHCIWMLKVRTVTKCFPPSVKFCHAKIKYHQLYVSAT